MEFFNIYVIFGLLLVIVLPCFCYFSYLAIFKSDLNSDHGRGRNTISMNRQGNVLTIHNETSRERRYDDIFFIEPNSVEAARIRAQLEKDDKDLPSYEEVVRMANLAQPTAAPAALSVATLSVSNASVNTTDTILPVPPYSEVDPYASTSGLTAVTSAADDATATAATTNANSGVVISLPTAMPIVTQQTSSNV